MSALNQLELSISALQIIEDSSPEYPNFFLVRKKFIVIQKIIRKLFPKVLFPKFLELFGERS